MRLRYFPFKSLTHRSRHNGTFALGKLAPERRPIEPLFLQHREIDQKAFVVPRSHSSNQCGWILHCFQREGRLVFHGFRGQSIDPVLQTFWLQLFCLQDVEQLLPHAQPSIGLRSHPIQRSQRRLIAPGHQIVIKHFGAIGQDRECVSPRGHTGIHAQGGQMIKARARQTHAHLLKQGVSHLRIAF